MSLIFGKGHMDFLYKIKDQSRGFEGVVVEVKLLSLNLKDLQW